MKYILTKALKMLKWNKRISLLLIFELVIGISVLTYALNLSFSLQKLERKFAENKNDVVLQMEDKDITSESSNIFDMNDYNYIRRVTNNKALIYISIPKIIIEENEMKEYTLLLMDYHKMKLKDNFFYYGERIYKDSKKINFTFSSLNPLKLSSEISSIDFQMEDGNLRVEDCMIIPLEYMEEIDFANEITNATLHIEIDSSDYNNIDEVMVSITEYMSKKYGDSHNFSMSSPSIDLKNNARKVKISVETLNKAGILILLVFFVGVVSIFQLIFSQRTKEYGICAACGATTKQLSTELVLEIFIISMVGSIVGCMLGFFATYFLNTGIMISIVKVSGHFQTILCCAFIGIGITLFASVFLVINIMEKGTALLFE